MLRFLALGGHLELREIKPRLLQEHEVELTIATFDDIELFIKTGNVLVLCKGKDIREFDFVWITTTWIYRPIACAISIYLQKNNIPFTPTEGEKSKLVDTMLMGLNNISIPDTYFSTKLNIKERLANIVSHCGYPFIIKTTRGSLGKGIFLVQSESEFYQVIPQLSKKSSYIYQAFIPNDFDYRIILSNRNVVSSERRTRQAGEFRNNVALGAVEEFLNQPEVPEDVIKLAVNSTSVLELDWTGVDIVTSTKTGLNYILELNRRPGLTQNSPEITAASTHILKLLTAEGLFEKYV